VTTGGAEAARGAVGASGATRGAAVVDVAAPGATGDDWAT
jgi:hypothetical protein